MTHSMRRRPPKPFHPYELYQGGKSKQVGQGLGGGELGGGDFGGGGDLGGGELGGGDFGGGGDLGGNLGLVVNLETLMAEAEWCCPRRTKDKSKSKPKTRPELCVIMMDLSRAQ